MEVNGIVITPQSGKAGVHSVSVGIAAINDDVDKTVRIDAVCGNKSAQLTIVHEGMRELLEASDGQLYASDGAALKALK